MVVVTVRSVDSPLVIATVVVLLVVSSPLRYVARFVDWQPRGRLADAGHRLATSVFMSVLALLSVAGLVLGLTWLEEFLLMFGLGLFLASLLQLTLPSTHWDE